MTRLENFPNVFEVLDLVPDDVHVGGSGLVAENRGPDDEKIFKVNFVEVAKRRRRVPALGDGGKYNQFLDRRMLHQGPETGF